LTSRRAPSPSSGIRAYVAPYALLLTGYERALTSGPARQCLSFDVATMSILAPHLEKSLLLVSDRSFCVQLKKLVSWLTPSIFTCRGSRGSRSPMARTPSSLIPRGK
jgi:hypothetical protein